MRSYCRRRKNKTEASMAFIVWRRFLVFVLVLVPHLGPLVVLCVIRLHGAQIGLAIISPHGIKPVTQQADAHRIPGNAEGGHSGPRVRLWVIPVIAKFGESVLFVWWKKMKSFIQSVWKPRGKWSPIPAHWQVLLFTLFNHRFLSGYCWWFLSAQTENQIET